MHDNTRRTINLLPRATQKFAIADVDISAAADIDMRLARARLAFERDGQIDPISAARLMRANDAALVSLRSAVITASPHFEYQYSTTADVETAIIRGGVTTRADVAPLRLA